MPLAAPAATPGKPNPGAITRWWWVRHAPVPNPEQRCYGQLDKPADCSNRELFEHQAALLPKNAVWYASNLSRAIDTAKALAAAGATMGKLEIEPALAEQSFGDWHGLTYEELGRLHGENHHFWLVPPLKRAPGGESFADLYDRTVDAVARMTERHRGGNIVAVAHGGTIRAALGLALGLDHEQAVRFETGNVSLTCMEHLNAADPQHAWRVVCVNMLPSFAASTGGKA
jgi:broad specificity phosphatase PhoE